MSVITSNTISDYIEKISKYNTDLNNYKFLRDYVLLFRGQSNKDYELLPSLGRNRSSPCECTIFNDERNLIEMAKYKLPNIFPNDLLPIELLALLQHHGIPTRLLDITENALVALYFACSGNEDKDGEVIVFKSDNNDVTNYPIINAIADTYRFTNDTWQPLSSFFGNVKHQPYFLEQQRMHEILHKDDNTGGQWISDCCKKIMYIYAPIRSMRQQMQQGRYILFPNNINYEQEIYPENCFEWRIAPIPKTHPDIVLRIVIPKEIKKQLLLDLSVLGIREDVLFCDNVDTVCKGIVDTFQRRYSSNL